MLLEELELDDTDARRVDVGAGERARTSSRSSSSAAASPACWPGSGCEEAGIPFTIVEKNAGPGGTWYENSYPGARVDVGNHFYCYSFEPSDHWTEFFAQQPELAEYFNDVMNAPRHRARHPLEHRGHRRRLVGRDRRLWQVRTRAADGTEDLLPARAIISAVGQLNRAHIPDIKGMHDFRAAFHSSDWDHSVDYRGKKVALIGLPHRER